MGVLLDYLKTASSCSFNYRKPLIKRNEAEIKEYLQRHDLPAEYLEELATSSGLEILGPGDVLRFLSIEDLRLINNDATYTSYLPFMFFFGTDNGDRLYAFDPVNEWGKGINAVFLISKGMLDRATSRFLGNTLPEVVEKLNSGIAFSDIPELDEESA